MEFPRRCLVLGSSRPLGYETTRHPYSIAATRQEPQPPHDSKEPAPTDVTLQFVNPAVVSKFYNVPHRLFPQSLLQIHGQLGDCFQVSSVHKHLSNYTHGTRNEPRRWVESSGPNSLKRLLEIPVMASESMPVDFSPLCNPTVSFLDKELQSPIAPMFLF